MAVEQRYQNVRIIAVYDKSQLVLPEREKASMHAMRPGKPPSRPRASQAEVPYAYPRACATIPRYVRERAEA